MSAIEDHQREKEIFERALDLESREERLNYIKGACAGNALLLARLEALLRSDSEANGFLADTQAARGHGVQVGATHPSEALGSVIGRYTLLQEIGHGGMGVVYLAEQEEPVRRRIALKIIKLGMDTSSVVARFEAERQALAVMDHPNIAKVFDGGATEAGRPYFVMELVRGTKITEYCTEAKLSTRDRLDLFINVCDAIQHAHQKGIIHRDIKPSNILVRVNDGIAMPKVIDFGIAKATSDQQLTDKTLFTAIEQFIGTPAYMSPEQAEMSGCDLDTRSDIYSLGVLLYELLTGQTPFDGKELIASGIDAMRKTIREKEPIRPSTRISQTESRDRVRRVPSKSTSGVPRAEVHTDLDWIVLKCLEKDRSRRYETAHELAKDIRRLILNEPIVARPPSTVYKFRKFVGRNRAMVSAGACVASVLILGTVISTWQAIKATHAQRQALKFRYAAEMTLAFESLASDNLRRARELLGKQQPFDGASGRHSQKEIDSRGWEWRHLWHQTRGDKHLALSGHSNAISGALFLNDGKTIASAGADDTLRLWDTERGVNTRVVRLKEGGSHFVALSPNGRWLAVGGVAWQLFDTARWQELPIGTNSIGAEVIAFSDDSQKLALLSGADVHLLDVASKQTLRIFHRSGIWDSLDQTALAFSPDGQRLAFCDADDIIRIFNLPNETELIVHPRQAVLTLVFSRDGRFLITGGRGGIEILNSITGGLVDRLTGPREAVSRVTVSRDGRFLASTSADQTVRLWDAISWQGITTLHGHEQAAWSVGFSTDATRLVSAGEDRQVRVWDLRALARSRDTYISADNAPIHWPLPHGDRAVLLFGNLPYAPVPVVRAIPKHVQEAIQIYGNRGAVSYLDCVSLEESARETTPPSFSSAQVMAFGFNGTSVALGWADGHIEFWKTQPFRQVRTYTGSTSEPMHLAVAENGLRVSIHRADDTVEIWNPVTGAIELRLPVLKNLFAGPNCGFWAHDSILARFSEGSEESPPMIELWSLPEGRRRVFAHQKGGLWTQAVSNDGKMLATSGWDGALRLWDMHREQPIDVITGQLKTYYSLIFSPDDSRLVGGGYDGTITMWDMTTLQQVAHWKAHDRECAWMRFVGKNEDLFSLGNLNFDDRCQGEIRLWRAPSLSEIDALRTNP
jgi:WD40 repeat protein/serine/threonine protein kinase